MRRIVAAVLLALGGCSHGSNQHAGPDMAFAGAFAAHDKVDILIEMDNSITIPLLIELRNDFPELYKALDTAGLTHPASYHIGLITADLGAGLYNLNQGQCHPDGDGGKLQVAPNPPGYPVPPNCAGFTLGGGVNFIDYDQIAGTNNVGTFDVPSAFDCISEVGDGGCGFEHQLESAYRALHDPPPENVGFLRDDALLVVLFLTDEDDCSAPPTTDLFDPSPDGIAKYGPLHSFRCTQFGIACGDPAVPVSGTVPTGPRSDCRPLSEAEGGKLFDLDRYINFFARPGGVKADPSDVILASISVPPTPLTTTLTMPCADQVNTPQCMWLSNNCPGAGTNGSVFNGGNPAIRLSAVVGSAYTSQQMATCSDSFPQTIDNLAQKIIARLQ
jgi:hypothetical protein